MTLGLFLRPPQGGLKNPANPARDPPGPPLVGGPPWAWTPKIGPSQGIYQNLPFVPRGLFLFLVPRQVPARGD